jgi:hypothetical protein
MGWVEQHPYNREHLKNNPLFYYVFEAFLAKGRKGGTLSLFCSKILSQWLNVYGVSDIHQ